MKSISLLALAVVVATASASYAQDRRTYAEPYPYHKSSGAQGYQVYPTRGCENYEIVGSQTRQICNVKDNTRDAKQFWDHRDVFAPGGASGGDGGR